MGAGGAHGRGGRARTSTRGRRARWQKEDGAMSTNGAPVVRLDHGVVATNDLGLSIVFLTQVLGADFRRLVNANLRGLDREVPEMAFFKLANHHGFGYALQGQPIPRPVPPHGRAGMGTGAERTKRRGGCGASARTRRARRRPGGIPGVEPHRRITLPQGAGRLRLRAVGAAGGPALPRPGPGLPGLVPPQPRTPGGDRSGAGGGLVPEHPGTRGHGPGAGRRPVDVGHRRVGPALHPARGSGDDRAEPLLARPPRGREGGHRRLRRVRVAADQHRALLGPVRRPHPLARTGHADGVLLRPLRQPAAGGREQRGIRIEPARTRT